jgi:hypothetical protein
VVLNDRRRGRRVTTWGELRTYGIDWYRRNRGIHF